MEQSYRGRYLQEVYLTAFESVKSVAVCLNSVIQEVQLIYGYATHNFCLAENEMALRVGYTGTEDGHIGNQASPGNVHYNRNICIYYKMIFPAGLCHRGEQHSTKHKTVPLRCYQVSFCPYSESELGENSPQRSLIKLSQNSSRNYVIILQVILIENAAKTRVRNQPSFGKGSCQMNFRSLKTC